MGTEVQIPQFNCRDIVRSKRSTSTIANGMIYEVAIQDENTVCLVGLSEWFPAGWFELVHRPNSPSAQHRPIVIPCSSRKDGTRKWIVLADGWFRILSNEGESEWFCEENGPSVDLNRFYEFSRETKQELSQASDWAFVRIVCPLGQALTEQSSNS